MEYLKKISIYRINIGVTPIFLGFNNFHYALGLWIIMQSITFMVHPIFKVWANTRQVLPHGKSHTMFGGVILIQSYLSRYHKRIRLLINPRIYFLHSQLWIHIHLCQYRFWFSSCIRDRVTPGNDPILNENSCICKKQCPTCPFA